MKPPDREVLTIKMVHQWLQWYSLFFWWYAFFFKSSNITNVAFLWGWGSNYHTLFVVTSLLLRMHRPSSTCRSPQSGYKFFFLNNWYYINKLSFLQCYFYKLSTTFLNLLNLSEHIRFKIREHFLKKKIALMFYSIWTLILTSCLVCHGCLVSNPHSNSCMWVQTPALPRSPSTAAACMGRPVLSAALPETRTAPGMERPALATFQTPRGVWNKH